MNMKLTELLKKSLQHFKFKMLLVSTMLLFMNSLYAQDLVVKGTVADELKNPIPGANITIEGTTTGTLSDFDGKFSLKIPSSNSVLIVSFIGYENQKIKLNGSAFVNVVLKQKIEELENVVVVGYGQQKKSDLTGAIGSVSSKQLEKTPSSGVVQALQGKVAGVQVFNSSGMPGAPITVRVRGINTITKIDEWSGVSGPVYVIDGIPGDINSISPNDIEQIEVLKDASSQAIYGSSGGNGVILVTTKQGRKNQKAKIDFSMYRGIQTNDISVDMCNTKEFIQIYNSLESTKKSIITANPDSLP